VNSIAGTKERLHTRLSSLALQGQYVGAWEKGDLHRGLQEWADCELQ
jgi:hypothetical protein